MIDLPPEIWRNIIEFLPLKFLRTLYSLNHVFFDVVMNEKYRRVALDRPMDDYLMRQLESLRNPDIARRVNSFWITPDAFIPMQKNTQPRRHHKSSNLLDKVMRYVKKPQGKENDNPRQNTSLLDAGSLTGTLLEIARQMTSTNILCVRWEALPEIPPIYMDNLWHTVAYNLQELTLLTTITMMGYLLPLPAFPNLVDLGLSIKRGSNSQEASLQATQIAMASFVNSMKATIQSLKIHCIPEYDLPLLYQNLGRFEHLNSVDIVLAVPGNYIKGRSQSMLFLERHRDILRHVIVKPAMLQSYGTQTDTQNDIAFHNRFTFAKLITFSVTAEIWENDSHFLRGFLLVPGHLSTLQTLDIINPISPDEANDLLTALNHRTTNLVLRKLSISIYRLDLSLLRSFMECLPGLKVLRLRICKIANGTTFALTPGQFFPARLPPQEGVHGFVTEVMSCQDFKRWKLADILTTRRSCCKELTLWGLMHFFSLCIPTITSFGESGHIDIPDTPKLTLGSRRCSGGVYQCAYGTDGIDSTQPPT